MTTRSQFFGPSRAWFVRSGAFFRVLTNLAFEHGNQPAFGFAP